MQICVIDIWSTSVQVMACLFNTKPLPEPMQSYLKNAICKVSAILLRPQCVEPYSFFFKVNVLQVRQVSG